MSGDGHETPIQQVSGTVVPRFAGPSTFARLPELRDVPRCDVAILGVPFDSGTSYRPGARFGAPYTHGTPFRRAAEERLFLDDASIHVGIRGPLYSRQGLVNDRELGFKVIHCDEFQQHGIQHVVERIRKRIGKHPVYLSTPTEVPNPFVLR